jgi:uncharacterized protein (TIGR03437 family)
MELVMTRRYQPGVSAKSALLVAWTLSCRILLGQSVLPITGADYRLPSHIPVAPGQLITLIVYDGGTSVTQFGQAPSGADLPITLAGLSAKYQQIELPPLVSNLNAPLFQVLPFNAKPSSQPGFQGTELVAVTIQIPFEAVPYCDPGRSPPCLVGVGFADATLTVGETGNGGVPAPTGVQIDAVPLTDQVHILTACESFAPNLLGETVSATGLPCPSTVTHADGSLVSAKNPAKAGEELVAYALGLGQTSPPLATGKLVTAAVPTQTAYGLDFNYRPNALATKPLPSAPPPVYAGATPGYVGLYQINFVVPPVPSGTPACVDQATVPLGQNAVYSNLTVSVGGAFSFDGARICVAVPSP